MEQQDFEELLLRIKAQDQEIENLKKRLLEVTEAGQVTLKGCSTLVDVDALLGERIDQVNERIHIVNTRLRKLEEHAAKVVKRFFRS